MADIEDIAVVLAENGVTVKNKDAIVSALDDLASRMVVTGKSAEEEIAELEEAIGTSLTREQREKIASRYKGALDCPAEMRKALTFSRTCVNHTKRLVDAL